MDELTRLIFNEITALQSLIPNIANLQLSRRTTRKSAENVRHTFSTSNLHNQCLNERARPKWSPNRRHIVKGHDLTL